MVIVQTDAVGEPYAMMVLPGDAALAVAAMFTSRWFEKVARFTAVAWVEYDLVVRIALHLLRVIVRRDV